MKARDNIEEHAKTLPREVIEREYVALARMVERLAGITFNGQANPHLLLIEQHDRIKKLENALSEADFFHPLLAGRLAETE